MVDRRELLLNGIALAAGTLFPGSTTSQAEADTAQEEDMSRADVFRLELQADIQDFGPLPSDPLESFALSRNFTFSSSADGDPVFDKSTRTPRSNTHFGIDISHWQTGIDFSNLSSQKVRFCYVQVSQGDHADKEFTRHWKALGALKDKSQIARGGYHFLRPTPSGKDQATLFCDTIAAAEQLKPGDLVPVVDVESTHRSDPALDKWRALSPDEIIFTIQDYLNTLQMRLPGCRPIIYTGRSWWRILQSDASPTNIAFPKDLIKYRVWISDYGCGKRIKNSCDTLKNEVPRPLLNANCVLWQFTEQGNVASGYDDNLDCNVFYGTNDDFDRELRLRQI